MHNATPKYDWENNQQLTNEDKMIFLSAFGAAYQQLTPETLGLNCSIQDFLEQAFDSEKRYLSEHPNSIIIARASIAGNNVGFAIFEYDDDTVYLRQICVLPEHARKGIGLNLIGVLGSDDKIETIWLVTRRHNQSSIQFYQKYGFVQLDEASQLNGYSPERYVKFQMCWKKHIAEQLAQLNAPDEIFLVQERCVTQIKFADNVDKPPIWIFFHIDNVGDYLVDKLNFQYICEQDEGSLFRKV